MINNFNHHLIEFAKSFIDKKYTDRWIYILVKKPSKAKKELVKFEKHLNGQRCKILNHSQLNIVTNSHEAKTGVYFDGISETRNMSLTDAISESRDNVTDAIFSIDPGRKAIFLFHEGWGWICS